MQIPAAVLCCACAVALGRKTRLDRARLALLGMMGVLAVVHDAYVLPKAHEIRAGISTFDRDPVSEEERSARARFENHHRASVGIFSANLLFGAAAIALSAVRMERATP